MLMLLAVAWLVGAHACELHSEREFGDPGGHATYSINYENRTAIAFQTTSTKLEAIQQ